jgi:hypothetical protein
MTHAILRKNSEMATLYICAYVHMNTRRLGNHIPYPECPWCDSRASWPEAWPWPLCYQSAPPAALGQTAGGKGRRGRKWRDSLLALYRNRMPSHWMLELEAWKLFEDFLSYLSLNQINNISYLLQTFTLNIVYVTGYVYSFLSSFLVLIPQTPCCLHKCSNFFDLVTIGFYAETPQGTDRCI